MRGLDPRIHAVAGAAGVCCEDVDRRVEPGDDEPRLAQIADRCLQERREPARDQRLAAKIPEVR